MKSLFCSILVLIASIGFGAENDRMILDGTLPPEEITQIRDRQEIDDSVSPEGRAMEMSLTPEEKQQLATSATQNTPKEEIQSVLTPPKWNMSEEIRQVLFSQPISAAQPRIVVQSYIQMSSAFLLEDEPKGGKGEKKDANSEKSEKSDSPKPETVKTDEKPAPTLSPELEKLRDQIQTLLTTNSRRALSFQNNTPAEILAFCFVFGAETKVYTQLPQQQARNRRPVPTPEPIYGIGGLCWNYPGAGKTLLRADGNRVIPKVGQGLQRKPGTLLALLACSNIDEQYEIKIGEQKYTVGDLVAFEKANCMQGADLSLVLVGLSFYCDCDEQWTSESGETWSLSKLTYSELCRPADQWSSDITDQLLGFASVIHRFDEEARPLQGPLADAKKYLDSYMEFALSARNEQGLWHPDFFRFRGAGTDPNDILFAGGHIFRFLAFSLPEEKLRDPRVVQSATALADLTARLGASQALTERQNEAIATALHALAIYKERLTK